MDIVSWTFDCLLHDEDKPIFIDAADPSQSLSTTQARKCVRQMIAGLRAQGLQRGDTVCILSLSSIYYPILFLAIVGAGGVVAGGNPGHTVYELQHLFSKCAVKFVITESPLLAKATAAASTSNLDASRVFVCDGRKSPSVDSQSWRTLLQYGESDWNRLSNDEAASTPTAFYSTSGTTGAPKFAAISHSYHVTTGNYIESENLAKSYPVSRLVSLPLMHAFAAPLVHCAALRCGTPTYILSRFSVQAFVDAVSTHQITEFPVVPSMLIALTSAPACNATALQSVREVMCAGAPLSTSLAASFSTLLSAPSARLVQLYGSTEGSWISSIPWRTPNNFPHTASRTAPSFPLHKAATPTVGYPCTGYEMRLRKLGSTSIISDSDVPGELEIKVPHPFLYYVDAEQATKESFSHDGWLKTGDIASRDTQGRYYIVDRQKDMIKVRGWQVAPAEIESVLVRHEAVQDCAVIGVEDSTGASGELPWAFVALKADSGPTDTQIFTAWIRERLAGYKVPARIILVESIPRNPAGKILRRILRDQHINGTSTATPDVRYANERNDSSVVAVSEVQCTKAPPPTTTTTITTGNIMPSPTEEKNLQSVLPTWLAVDGATTRSWPMTDEETRDGHSLSAAWRRDSRLKLALTLLLPGAVGLGLCIWQTDLMHEARKWWAR